ncbi:MAG: ParB N-terminal domain-containing protein, partial [Oscillospiraceae bacterium]
MATTAAKTAVKPRLNSLNDLLRLNETIAETLPPQEASAETQAPPADTEYAIVEFSLMDDYPNHPFRLYEDARKEDMIESIRKNGILQPLILRARDDGRYTVLAGHNRKYNGTDAGLDRGPAIIKHNLTDDEAWMYVIETNLLQRSFSDMLPSEKAAVLAAYHSKMFSQGKRNDILAEIKSLENPQGAEKNSTSAEFRKSSGTRESLATEYGLKPNKVALYLRVHQLIDPLKVRLDKGEFALSPASDLSFLKAKEQKAVDKCIELNGFKVDVKKAAALREYSESKKLDDENVYLILNRELGQPPKKNRTPTVKVSKDIYSRYFTPEQSPKEVQDMVEKALGYYVSHLQSQEKQAEAPAAGLSADEDYHTANDD